MNIKDIAKLAGVSTSTVSKIMNKKDESISNDTRARVLKIAKEYNYSPYSNNGSSPAKSWTLGILLRSSVSIDTTLDGIIQTAQTNGYSTLVFNNYSNTEQELKNITSLCKQNVDGIIWEPVDNNSLTHAPYLENLNIPLLTIGASGGDNSLLLPYEEAAYRITQELIDQKHDKIACLLTEGRRTEAFLTGYKKCLFDNHLPFDKGLIFDELADALVHKVNNHHISGVISSHYRKASEFYHLMTSLSYKVPKDISLISLKNDTLESLDFPKKYEISTYTIRNSDFGSYLCSKLINQIEKKTGLLQSFVQEFHLDNQTTISIPFRLNAPKIMVVGSIHIDTFLSVSHLPHSGKTVSISNSSIFPGGKGMNQAIGAAKLGHRVALIGKVGSELDSDRIFKALDEYGVETSGITRVSHTNTGQSYIFVESNGESMISILPGANGTFSPEDIRKKRALFENTDYCLIQSEIPLETVAEACHIAHEYGATTILKPSAYGQIPKEILAVVDILIPNQDELNELCPNFSSINEQTDELLQYGIKTIIVTLGDRGCFVKTAEWEEYFSSLDFPSLDTTGASDAFISALASYLMYGYSLKKAVQIATYAAGFSISRDGVMNSLIDKHSLETFIKQKDNDLLTLPSTN